MTKRQTLIEGILHSFHAFHNMIRARAASLGHQNHITHAQWFVLTLIGHAQKRSIKELSDMLGMSSSAVTQFVDSLVESGHVTRHEDPKDRRLTQIGLTAKGKKHVTATKEKRIAEMEGLFDALTDTELEEYVRLQKKIISSLPRKKS